MDEPEVIEEFYGVYLLYCLNEKYIGKTYIGYTTDPNRRINQHNKGSWAGGARKTSNKGPWKMVMIIHGFPNNIAALRFEWAWQNPEKSRRLLHVENKKKHSRNEKQLCYRLRILSEMLRVGPWNRLPLTIRWLAEEFSRDFLPDKLPPLHMPICYGPVKSKKVSRTRQHNLADGDIPIKSGDQKYIGKTSPRKNNCHAKMKKSKIEQSKTTESISCSRSDHRSDGYRENAVDYLNSKANRYGDKASYSSSDIKDSNVIENDYCENIIRCGLCYKLIQDGNMKLTCLNEECDLVCHMYCLAELFLESGEYVPIEGDCPFCTKRLLWGDLIRKLKGCQDLQRRYEGNLSNDDFSENEDDNSDLSGTDLKNQSDTSMRSDKIILNLSDSE